MKLGEVGIFAAKRLPQGRYAGKLAGEGAVKLGQDCVRGLLNHAVWPSPSNLIWGMARSHTQGMNPGRTIALGAGLPVNVPATTVNMACGSSLQALIYSTLILQGGAVGPVVAGGSEAMSDTPYLLPGLRRGYQMGHRDLPDVMIQDGLRCPISGLLMGETIERLAARYGVTREESDAFSKRSHQRASSADFSKEILLHARLASDECVRPEISSGVLASLRPVFSEDGQITAGNASALSDGAAAVLLARISEAEGTAPLARILGWSEAAVDPLDMGEAPVPAVRHLLAEHGLVTKDIDLWEINEAFAAQVLVCAAQLNLDSEKLNVAGGGVALGHPIGASGVRIVVTLIHQLRNRGGGLGVATLGIGGGLGLALLIEVRV